MSKYAIVHENWVNVCEQFASRSCPASKLLYPLVIYSLYGKIPKNLNRKQKIVLGGCMPMIDETLVRRAKREKYRITKTNTTTNTITNTSEEENLTNKFDNVEELWKSSKKR